MDDLNEEVQKVAEDIVNQAHGPFKQEAMKRIIGILMSYHELREALAESNEPNETRELTDDEKKILVFLSTHGETSPDLISQSLNLSPPKTQYYLDRMYSRYVHRADFTGGESLYYLTEEGTAYLVENGLVT